MGDATSFGYELVCARCSVMWAYTRSRPGKTPACCLACTAEKRTERQRQNLKSHNAATKRWRLRNPEKMAKARAAWEKSNPEVRRGYRRARKKMDPVTNRAYVMARKARQRGQTVIPFTPAQLRQRIAYFGDRCWMCGAPGETVDHVKPLARGGAHALSNMRPACVQCNSSKGARWPWPTSLFSSRGEVGAPIVNVPSPG